MCLLWFSTPVDSIYQKNDITKVRGVLIGGNTQTGSFYCGLLKLPVWVGDEKIVNLYPVNKRTQNVAWELLV